MISFIVIGKNIEKTIALCLESIFRFTKENHIYSYEIIYVDSDSSDKTIEISKLYPVRIILITGQVNAAVGRNEGAKHAKGEILFFIDGDMELIPDFWDFIYDEDRKELKYPFISGYLRHQFYDVNFNYIYTRDDTIAEEVIHRDVVGGLMLVEQKYWKSLGGMDERLIRNQDIDFGLRMARTGHPALLDNHLFAVHYTISYYDKKRFTNFYLSYALLSPGLLMRKHLFNLGYLNIYYRNVLYVSLLLIGFLMLIIQPLTGLFFLLIYILIHLSRTIYKIREEEFPFRSFLFKNLFNFYSLIGLFFYFPHGPDYKISELVNRNINNSDR